MDNILMKRKPAIPLLVRFILLFAIVMLLAGCSGKNDNTDLFPEISSVTANSTESAPAASSVKEKTEAPTTAEQINQTDQAEQSEDVIVMNRFMEDTYSIPMAAEIRDQDDPRMKHVTVMSWEELSDYYDLIINEEALTGIIRDVSGKDCTCFSYSAYLPSTGIYQDGEKVYDGNVLQFSSGREEVTIVFFKDSNIFWPGSESLRESDPAEDSYEKSRISGIECMIGHPVNGTAEVDEKSYEIRTSFRDTEMTVSTYGLSEEQVITLFQEVCVFLNAS